MFDNNKFRAKCVRKTTAPLYQLNGSLILIHVDNDHCLWKAEKLFLGNLSI